MILYTGKTYNKSYLKEEGRSDLSSNPKNFRFNKSSLTFNRYKHFNYNKSLFELGNIPLDTLLECINKITTILDKYVNDVSPFNPKLKRLFIQDLARERDEIAEDRVKIGKELVLKFNVDRLCENAIKHKLNGNELDLNKFNISVIPAELETDKNFFNTPDSKRTRSEKVRPGKQKTKSDGKKGRSGKKADQIIDSSNLNYYIKYFNYLKLYYQYYLNHFVSVYIFYKSYSNWNGNDKKGSLIHIKDGERTVYILGKLFVYFRKLIILHLKCLVNLLPLSFVYNPDNFINYNGLVDYNDVIYCEMNSLGDIDSGLRLELKRDLFDCLEINRKFDLEEFNSFLNVNNLNNVALGSDRPATANIPTDTIGDDTSRVDNGHPNVSLHGGTDNRIHPDDITNFATAVLSPPLYPINTGVTPGITKKSINLLVDPNSNFNATSLRHENKPFNMATSVTSSSNKTAIEPTNASTVKSEAQTYNIPPTTSGATSVTNTSGATNGNDGFSPTNNDFGKDNSTSNNNHSDGRHIDSRYNDGKYDSRHDGRYDPRYRDTRDDRYHDKPKNPKNHDKHYVKHEDGGSDSRYGDRYTDNKYDAKYHESQYDIRHYTSNYDDRRYTDSNYDLKHDDRRYDERHDMKHDERRYMDSHYDDRRYDLYDHRDTRHHERRLHDDISRYSGGSRSGSSSGSSSSRYSDNSRYREKRRHSDSSYDNPVMYSYDNRRYSKFRRHDSRRDRRYSNGRYGGRRSFSHSSHSSHSSSSSNYHPITRNRRSTRRTNHPRFKRSSSSGSSSSAYSTNRGFSSEIPLQNMQVKPELESQNTPQSSARVDIPGSSNHGKDSRNVKIGNSEKERLGNELRSGKKLKNSNKFSTMNIREIFNNLASKAQQTNAPATGTNTTSAPTDTTANTVNDSHIGYKSTGPSDITGSKDGGDAVSFDGGSSSSANTTSSMVVDANSNDNSMVTDTTSNSMDTDPSANKGGASRHMGEASGNNSDEINGDKTDDPPFTSVESYIDNIK